MLGGTRSFDQQRFPWQFAEGLNGAFGAEPAGICLHIMQY